MARKKVGALSTGEVLLGAVVVIGVGYLLTRPKAPTTVYLPPPAGSGSSYGNSTSSIITASGGAFSDIWGSIFGNP